MNYIDILKKSLVYIPRDIREKVGCSDYESIAFARSLGGKKLSFPVYEKKPMFSMGLVCREWPQHYFGLGINSRSGESI